MEIAPENIAVKPGDDDDDVTFGCALDAGEQTDRADQTVLNAEYKLANPRAAFDDLLLLLDGIERHRSIDNGKWKIEN